MAYCRDAKRSVVRPADLAAIPNGRSVRIAGCVIARQRPGTAKGFRFLSIEDETGIANAIVTPDMGKNRTVIVQSQFLFVEASIQNPCDGRKDVYDCGSPSRTASPQFPLNTIPGAVSVSVQSCEEYEDGQTR